MLLLVRPIEIVTPITMVAVSFIVLREREREWGGERERERKKRDRVGGRERAREKREIRERERRDRNLDSMLDPDDRDNGDKVMARTITECVCVSECNHETMLDRRRRRWRPGGGE